MLPLLRVTKMCWVPSARPYFPPDEIDRILEELRKTLENGALTQGSHVREFEALFARYVGVRHAVAVSNGTAALEIVLRYFDLRGAEVIVPTNTFLASANAVIFAGGAPVFADVEGSWLCLGLEQVTHRLTDRTRGVIVVHIAGMICPETERIRQFCKVRNLFLIEDAAHAHGAQWNGRKAGSLTDAGTFSFYPTKPMTTAEGGMITTDNDALADFARSFRSHGVPPGASVHQALGHNHRMDEVRAVLGISQLRKLEEFLMIRRSVARHYESALKSFEGVATLTPPAGFLHSYYKFPIVLPTPEKRDAVAKALKTRHSIDSGTVYWPPCRLQPVVRARPDIYPLRGTFPIAEDILPRVLCLPIHAQVDRSVADRVVGALKNELEQTHVRC